MRIRQLKPKHSPVYVPSAANEWIYFGICGILILMMIAMVTVLRQENAVKSSMHFELLLMLSPLALLSAIRGYFYRRRLKFLRNKQKVVSALLKAAEATD